MPDYRPLPTLERLGELLEVVETPEDKFGERSAINDALHNVGALEKGRELVEPSELACGCEKRYPAIKTK